MLRSLRFGLIALATLASSSVFAPVSAQTFTLPEIGLQASGACPQLAMRERTGKTMVPLGCLDGTAKVIRWSGDGSGISLTPSASAASGTLARLIAERAPLASPAFTGSVVNAVPTACPTTAGNWTGNGLATWVPTCFGAFMSADKSGITIYPTRGTPSSNGLYPPNPEAGTPTTTNNNTANLLVQTKADGSMPKQTSSGFFNIDVVGGTVSAAHPSDAESPNATGLMITSQQRPGPAGQSPPAFWSINTDHVIAPGSGNTKSFGMELDLSNFNADCKVGENCTSAWFFYGGINAFPNLAVHYMANPHTQSYSGTATVSGATLTKSSGTFSQLITRMSYGGQTFRVDCTTTTCTADYPIGNSATPLEFKGYSAMAHTGLFFQDSADGTYIQDHDFYMGDSARSILTAAGKHRIGLDFTQDALPFAALFKGGQQVCYNGAAMCMSYSGGPNAWLFAPGTDPGAHVARIGATGDATFNGIVSANSFSANNAIGVSCSGPPTQNFQTVNGIVTRC
ncbi:exported protein of unknown function [Methylorubrum extorquens]|uniref:Secreted protein n=1 Tax=Methylorubrum extorquens TaxID=408 RepID=A0A2N9AIC1_METEX|nr:exported protein of unknown function [Methylorubrum extorquens]